MRWLLLTILFTPSLVAANTAAVEFVPLIGIPGIDPNNLNTEAYINALYILAISAAAFLTVGRLIYAGIQYILSDVVTDKADAKRDLRQTFTGLLIVLTAVLILNTINPDLTNLNFLRTAETFTGSTSGGTATTVAERPTECRMGDFNCIERCENAGGNFSEFTGITSVPQPCSYPEETPTAGDTVDPANECTRGGLAVCNAFCRNEFTDERDHDAKEISGKIYCIKR